MPVPVEKIPACLDAMPDQIVLAIAAHLDVADLLVLRLACKRVHAAATEQMLTSVTVGPHLDVGEKRDLSKLAERDDLGKLVKYITYNTRDFDEEEVERAGPPEEWEDEDHASVVEWRRHPGAAFYRAMGAAGVFPNLRGVALRFSAKCSSAAAVDDDGVAQEFDAWTAWPQDVGFRQPILRGFFAGLVAPHAGHVTDICLDNVQNINDPLFMGSAQVRTALSRLAALRLYIATETLGYPHESLGPWVGDLYKFTRELPSLWLRPAANNLTTLVLYQDKPFGYSPKLDLRQVHLPNLKTLALGRYTFSHDWQLTWLQDHTPTLETLFLDGCSVVYYTVLLSERDDSEGYPAHPSTWLQAGDHGHPVARFTGMNWTRIFRHLKTQLTSLCRFEFGRSVPSPSSPRAYDFALPPHERIQPGFFPSMYQAFVMPVHAAAAAGFRSRVLEYQRGPEGYETDQMDDFEQRLDDGTQAKEDAAALEALIRVAQLRRAGRIGTDWVDAGI